MLGKNRTKKVLTFFLYFFGLIGQFLKLIFTAVKKQHFSFVEALLKVFN